MHTYEKERWLELACSEQPDSRQLALDLAASIADDIQHELLVWMLINDNLAIKFQLYQLLNASSLELLQQWQSETAPQSLNTLPDYDALNYTDDTLLQTLLLDHITEVRLKKENSSPLFKYVPLLAWCKDYSRKANSSLKTAADVVRAFRSRYKQAKGIPED